MPVNTEVRLRQGTAAEWTSENPVLEDGEPGYETDTGFVKIGDGSTAWNALLYSGRPITAAALTMLGLSDVIGVRRSILTLNNAATKALAGAGTATDIVAAPGAGIIAMPRRIVMVAECDDGAYTNIHANAEIAVRWGFDEDRIFHRLDEDPDGRVSSLLADGDRYVVLALDVTEEVGSPHDLSKCVNRPISLEFINASGALTGGHGNNQWHTIVDYDLISF